MFSMFLAQAFGLKRKDFVIARIVILVLLYFLIYKYLTVLLLVFVPFWAFTIFAYQREKSKVLDTVDTFEDDNLFYRYGTKISSEALPIKFSEKMDDASLLEVSDDLNEHLVASIRDEIDYSIQKGHHRTEIINITDKNFRSDPRDFTRFSYVGLRGGEVNHFILFEYIGSYMLIHMDSYFKGIPHWYDKAHFVLSSPYRLWFWVIPWLRNDFSILTKLSKYLDNSFEAYDLESYYTASRYSILDTIKEYLNENRLMTPELEQMINYQIIMNQNINNGNQVSVGGSNNIISSLSQKIK